MEKKLCEKCGREYVRKECEFCARVNRWEKLSVEKRFEMFPPRIQQEVLSLQFTEEQLKDTQVFHSRYIYGCPGTGKTMFAARTAYELMKKNIAENQRWDEIVFITMPDLLQKIRRAFDRDAKISEMEIIDFYRKADFLIIDDFGVQKDTDWTFQIIYALINYRYEYLLPTIITSNDTLKKIEQTLDDHRLTSRIAEMCEQIHMTTKKRKPKTI